MISSQPITMIRPPITGIGMRSASEPSVRTSRASHRPAKIPVQRVRAPALTAMPVRDIDPPAGSAPNRPPPMLPRPCATKSPFTEDLRPSGLGTVGPMEAAWARPTNATAKAPGSRVATAERSGAVNEGSAAGICAMSRASSTCVPRMPTPTLTRSRAIRIATGFSLPIIRTRAQTATAARAVRVAAGFQSPKCQSQPVSWVSLLWPTGL